MALPASHYVSTAPSCYCCLLRTRCLSCTMSCCELALIELLRGRHALTSNWHMLNGANGKPSSGPQYLSGQQLEIFLRFWLRHAHHVVLLKQQSVHQRTHSCALDLYVHQAALLAHRRSSSRGLSSPGNRGALGKEGKGGAEWFTPPNFQISRADDQGQGIADSSGGLLHDSRALAQFCCDLPIGSLPFCYKGLSRQKQFQKSTKCAGCCYLAFFHSGMGPM